MKLDNVTSKYFSSQFKAFFGCNYCNKFVNYGGCCNSTLYNLNHFRRGCQCGAYMVMGSTLHPHDDCFIQFALRTLCGISFMAWGPRIIPAISHPSIDGIFILVISFPATKARASTALQRNILIIILYFSFRNSIQHIVEQFWNNHFMHFNFFR